MLTYYKEKFSKKRFYGEGGLSRHVKKADWQKALEDDLRSYMIYKKRIQIIEMELTFEKDHGLSERFKDLSEELKQKRYFVSKVDFALKSLAEDGRFIITEKYIAGNTPIADVDVAIAMGLARSTYYKRLKTETLTRMGIVLGYLDAMSM